MQRFQPLKVRHDDAGNSTIQIPSRLGILEVFVAAGRAGETPESIINRVISRINDGISFIDEETLLRARGQSRCVH